MTDHQQEQNEGFRVVDKRAGAADDRESAPPAGAPESAPTDAASDTAGGEEDLEPIDIHGIVQYCITLLSGHAWQWMGLVMNPVTRKVERDLSQARAAIDCVEALFKQVEATMPEPAARQIRQALADLRVNFVRQSSQ